MHHRPARRPRPPLAVAAVLALLSSGLIAATTPPDAPLEPPASAQQEPVGVTPPDKGPGEPVVELDPTQPPELEQSGRAATDVADQIDRECTTTSAQILTTLQNLGGRQQFTTVRHRGDFDARTPENSLPAFEQSYLRCRAGVETDLRRTSDGVLVMFHDTRLGKMLEPTYSPEQNTGPNPALASTTWAQLQQKDLLDIARQPQAGVKVPSFAEFLDHYRRVGGRSLLYVEIKNTSTNMIQSQNEILAAVEELNRFHHEYPEANMFDRVVFKFRMSAWTSFNDWQARALRVTGIPKLPLSQVMTSRQIARQIGGSGTYQDTIVTTWARTTTADRVLSVEVTMKDSTAYSHLTLKQGPPQTPAFSNVQYYAPAGNATAPPGTMASAAEIVKRHNKPLGQFVPIPDWVMFRDPRTFDWNQVLRNADAGMSTVPVTPREAYFNNDSRCCYALRDRIDGSTTQDRDPEQNDQRILLPWMEDIGATFLTADDTDSIDAYFATRGKKLDTGDNRVRPNRPDLEMNSLIHPDSRQIPSLLKYVQVTVRPVSESSRWHVTGTVQLTEQWRGGVPATMRDYLVAVDSRHSPFRAGAAVYGHAHIGIQASWRWSSGPSDNFAGAGLTIDLPEHVRDGRYTQEMRLADGTRLNVQYTVSRQWAVARDFTATLLSNDTWQLYGGICGFSSGPPAAGSTCGTGDLSETRKIFDLTRSERVQVAPNATIPLSTDIVAGARPLFVRTDVWGRRVLPDMSLSNGTLALDDWGSEFGVRQTRTIGGTSPHSVRIGYVLDAGSNRSAP
jgi:glycerophosphoryl diester phosphodiesterase